ncbi:MAG: hypothetical protein QW270_08825 [Candidatus Bathyarchaeia archaeon]
MGKQKIIILLFLYIFTMAPFLRVPQVKAVVTITREFVGSAFDGFIIRANYTSYVDARNAEKGNVVTDSVDTIAVGQTISPKGNKTDWIIYRGFVFFDTSAIPSNANITSATLSLCAGSPPSNVTFNVTIQNAQVAHTPLKVEDYNYSLYSGNGGSRSVHDGFAINSYWNITLNAEGLNWIEKGGWTKLCLRSSHDIDNVAPTLGKDEYVTFFATEHGWKSAPKLYVTYTVEKCQYIVHGPYYEDGNVANCTVNVTLNRQMDEPSNFSLDGTDGTADTVTIDIKNGSRGLFLTWNASAYGSRIYYLADAVSEEIWIYVLDPNKPVGNYTFTVTDHAGLTNAYLEYAPLTLEQRHAVERYNLQTTTSAVFLMQMESRYDVRLVCDQGIYTWGNFTPLTGKSQNIIIAENMFPPAHTSTNINVTATRLNATWIQINYMDYNASTVWVNVEIQHWQNNDWVTAYAVNNTGNMHRIDWYTADDKKDYTVKVSAYYNGQIKTWSFTLPKPEPPLVSQIIGLLIVLAVFAAFSYVRPVVGCILGILTAITLACIEWLQIIWTLLASAMVIIAFAALNQAKKRKSKT